MDESARATAVVGIDPTRQPVVGDMIAVRRHDRVVVGRLAGHGDGALLLRPHRAPVALNGDLVLGVVSLFVAPI